MPTMAYLTPALRSRIQLQIATKELQLEAANNSLTAALGNAEVQTYQFDSGEGRQSTTRRKPEEIIRVIRQLESEIERLYRRLSGSGLVNMNLRRIGLPGRLR
jgi:hypothetical protein